MGFGRSFWDSGYIHKFMVCGDNLVPDKDIDPGIGKSGSVVLDLSENLPAGVHLYFDNYFSLPELLDVLKKRDFHAT